MLHAKIFCLNCVNLNQIWILIELYPLILHHCKRNSVVCHIYWKSEITIIIWFKLTIFSKKFFLCKLKYGKRLLIENKISSPKINTYISDWKKITIRRIAVWETGVSRHNGAPNLKPPSNHLDHHSTIVMRILREALKWAPLYRETLCLEQRMLFFSSLASFLSKMLLTSFTITRVW